MTASSSWCSDPKVGCLQVRRLSAFSQVSLDGGAVIEMQAHLLSYSMRMQACGSSLCS